MVDAGGASVPEGTVLEERYRLDRRIGAGGFANVYAGTHLLLGVPVAVKMLRLPRDVTGEQRRRLVDAFAAEARLLTRLRDERIVRTLDQGLYAGPEMEGPTPYLVLEWCGEETLKDVLARRTGRAVPLSAALWVADAVAGAAAAAHALGVAHRDLKPSNVMLPEGPEGKPEPRVIDFGIAKVFDEAETAGSGETATRSIDTPFTPAYAAPEQIARTRTGPWTDVHAIGLLFVELVSGRPPYSSQSAGLGAVDPARPTPAAHGIDVGPIEPVISRALSLRPADRYRDASELREALRRAALSASHPIPASFPGWDPGPLELAETISSPPQMTQPISHTIPADASRRTEGDARRAVGRRVGIALSASGAAAAAAGAIGLWWSGRGSTAQESAAGSTEPLGAAPSSHAPPVAPAPSVVPAGKNRHLRECTLEELAALMKGAGLAVTSTGEHAHAKRWYQASYETGKGTGYGYVIELAMPPDAEPAHYPMFTLADLRKWIKGDRSIGQNLAYAIQDNWIICLAGYDADRTIAAFGQMTAPFAVGTRYDSFDGPDPANVPSDSRPLWLAKKLADLTYVELDLRIRAAGASAALTPERAEWRFALTADKHTGELRLFGKLASPEPLHERFMADLRARKAPFSYAEQPEAALVATGSGDFGTKAFLENVLGGMDVDVRSSA